MRMISTFWLILTVAQGCANLSRSKIVMTAPFTLNMGDTIQFDGREYIHRIYMLPNEITIDGYWNWREDTLRLVPNKRRMMCTSRPVLFMIAQNNQFYSLNRDKCHYFYSLAGLINYLAVSEYAVDRDLNLHKVTHSLYEIGCSEGDNPHINRYEYWINSFGVIEYFSPVKRSCPSCYFGYESSE